VVLNDEAHHCYQDKPSPPPPPMLRVAQDPHEVMGMLIADVR
jgi:hypothetical protein